MLSAKSRYLAIDTHHRANQIALDAKALDVKLDSLTDASKDAQESEATFTATNTTDDHLGRTEIMLGNSEAAKRGKFTSSQTGVNPNVWPWIIGIGIVVLILVIGSK